MVNDLFLSGNFTLAHGGQSKWKIDCDSLSNNDLETIGSLLLPRLNYYSEVVGVPSGGLRLAQVMERYKVPHGGLLVVDDVLTTGTSMSKYKKDLGGYSCQGIVIFRRTTPGYHDLSHPWIKSLFTMDSE